MKWFILFSVSLVIGAFGLSTYQQNKIISLQRDNINELKQMISLKDKIHQSEIEKLEKEINLLKFTNELQKTFKVSGLHFDPEVIRTILEKTSETNYDLDLILAIIYKESRFRPQVRSRVAYGLMQINYGVWKDQFEIDSRDELYDPGKNLEIGFQIIEHYFEKTGGKLERTLHYYNNGPSRKYNNTDYAKTIMGKYRPKFKEIIEKFDGQNALYRSVLRS